MLLCWLALGALCGCGHGSGGGTSAATKPTAGSLPASAGGAAALLGAVRWELAAMRTTRYQHKTEVDEAGGAFFYDCSGLLDYALGRVLPTSTSTRPLAADIEHYLRGGLAAPVGGWQALGRVDALQPGDTGLGTGTIGLVADTAGDPTAFYWQSGVSKHAKPTEIALGRAD